jgi:murein DD-endopeptidase MepM/ murein hydrolase activator NlpD
MLIHDSLSLKLRHAASCIVAVVSFFIPLSAHAYDLAAMLNSITSISSILTMFYPPVVVKAPFVATPVGYADVMEYPIPMVSLTRYNGPSGGALYGYGSPGNYKVSDTPPSLSVLTNSKNSGASVGPYTWPVEGNISSGYGMRERTGSMCHSDDRGDGNLIKHCGVHMHNGIDIAVRENTPVQSVSSGKVVWVSPPCSNPATKEDAGCVVSVMTPAGELSTYMHLNRVANGIKVGSTIEAGDSLAASGNTGTATTGAHLHFEMCQVPPGLADGRTNPFKLCTASGSERIDPLTKLTSEDPRFATAKKKGSACAKKSACSKTTTKTILVAKKSPTSTPDTVQTKSSPSNFQGL